MVQVQFRHNHALNGGGMSGSDIESVMQLETSSMTGSGNGGVLQGSPGSGGLDVAFASGRHCLTTWLLMAI